MTDAPTQRAEMPESWWEERAEAFEAWADSVDPADLKPGDTRALQAITRLSDLRKEVDAAILDAVREARRARSTWSEIGAMLGVTKQAAQHKYAPAITGAPTEGSTEQPGEQEPTASQAQQTVPDPGGMEARLKAERTGLERAVR